MNKLRMAHDFRSTPRDISQQSRHGVIIPIAKTAAPGDNGQASHGEIWMIEVRVNCCYTRLIYRVYRAYIRFGIGSRGLWWHSLKHKDLSFWWFLAEIALLVNVWNPGVLMELVGRCISLSGLGALKSFGFCVLGLLCFRRFRRKYMFLHISGSVRIATYWNCSDQMHARRSEVLIWDHS